MALGFIEGDLVLLDLLGFALAVLNMFVALKAPRPLHPRLPGVPTLLKLRLAKGNPAGGDQRGLKLGRIWGLGARPCQVTFLSRTCGQLFQKFQPGLMGHTWTR